MTERQPRLNGRLRFIDGLRAIAALAVIVPHTIGLFAIPTANACARVFVKLAPCFAQGVQVFFVISGFAIAFSLRGVGAGPSFSIPRFIVRRAVRLDPPYWMALLIYGLTSAARAVANHQTLGLPGLAKSVAHLFYLQDVLGYGQFNLVFWTLCLEFQLYILFALFLRVSFLLDSLPISAAKRESSAPTLLLGAFLVSFVVSHLFWPMQKSAGWCFPFLYVFLAGALACWRAIGRISDAAFVPCLLLMCAGCIWDPRLERIFAVFATLAVYLAIKTHSLNTWLAQRPVQLLARISYSIYLLHVPVAVVLGGLRNRFANGSNAVSLLAFLTVYLATISLAYGFYSVVEVPCLRVSERLKVVFATPRHKVSS